jgi:hypothetical protein
MASKMVLGRMLTRLLAAYGWRKQPAIMPLEVIHVLHDVLDGKLAGRFDPAECDSVVAPLRTDSGWYIGFFDDGSLLDYVDAVAAPDGRRSDYGEWADWGDHANFEPLGLMSRHERDLLQRKYEAERGW